MVQPYSHRQLEILDQVRAAGTSSIDDLSHHFSVSAQTIRRDVNQLCERGELRRIRGGVKRPPLNPSPLLLAGDALEQGNVAGRAAIGNKGSIDRILPFTMSHKPLLVQKIADLVEDEASLAVAASSCHTIILAALQGKRGLKIFTNDLNLALMGGQNADWTITIASGRVNARENQVQGPKVADFFSRFEVDMGILSATNISPSNNILHRREEEADIHQAILGHARQSMLVIEQEQHNTSAHIRGASLKQLQHIIR